jgi:mono/diheme cytochrome c family protein
LIVRCIIAILAACLLALEGVGAQPSSKGASTISAFAARKARTLLHQQLPCLGCHALGDSGGRLAPDLATVRERRSPDYIAAMIDDPQRTAPGSLMPRTAMLPATRDLIVRYLQSLPGEATDADGAPLAAPPVPGATDGMALYIRWCAACHGTTGRGDGPNAPFLPVKAAEHASSAAMSARTDDALFDTIMGGGSIMNRSPRMPAFGETLSRTDVRALVQYIRTLCRCQGPAWSRDGSSPPG